MNATPSVSFFEKLYLSVCNPLTLEEIIILIRTRRWVKEITAYRKTLAEGNKEDARLIKGKLPGFTPSGLFRGGHKAVQLASYSRVIALDFDHVSNLLPLVNLCKQQPHTLAFFVSPSGKGLKVFVPVDADSEHHAAAFAAVAARYEQLAGVLVDPTGKDISRCCYVSYDPDAWYNPAAEVFAIASVSPAQVFVHDKMRANPPTEGNRNQTVYRLGCEANRRGFDRLEIASFCAPLMHSSDFLEAELNQALSSAYQGHTSEHSSRKDPGRTQKDIKDTGTVSGEELRHHTPFLPENLTSVLPPLLVDALRFYTDPRERDMALLAACTVVSACLPGVWGRYHRKKVYPHLFTVEVAPAANGKGCINDMRHLADHYASLIEMESKRKADDYLQQLEEWDLKAAATRRKGQPVHVADAPLKENVCYFMLPTQITKAKLLVHLADNGELGGLMVDSEIDTLINAGRQDYGQFDDLLRKAFHHEPIGSSRKTDNEIIRIERPRLAVLLAGTPAQFTRLVPNAENGLASRLLLYTCRSAAVWQDVSSPDDSEHADAWLDQLSERLLQGILKLRKRPLQVRLTKKQWQELNQHFGQKLLETDLFGCEEFLGTVKRYALMAYRLCIIFTALDVAALDYGIDSQYCSDPHFHAALSIIDVCLEHSRLLMTQLDHPADITELSCPDYFRRLYDQLGDRFTLAELYALSQVAGINDRTVRRHLSRLEPVYITRISPGVYRKNTSSAS